jgi:hypothetical protein
VGIRPALRRPRKQLDATRRPNLSQQRVAVCVVMA